MSVADFQSRSSRVGRSYEQQVVDWLEGNSFTITGRNVRHASGIQLDIDAVDPFGKPVGIECKASDDNARESSRGMRRSDNRWKVLGYLWALRVWNETHPGPSMRYMLFTSDMPEPGSVQRHLLDRAEVLGDLIIINLPFESE